MVKTLALDMSGVERPVSGNLKDCNGSRAADRWQAGVGQFETFKAAAGSLTIGLEGRLFPFNSLL